ncbi:MAG: ion transporter [Phycisphaerae bacterium]|nr:ion transporter [Phycisphaerae bacterium]
MDTVKNRRNVGWRKTAYEVIFESDTPAGKWFDILLIASVVLNVVIVMLDSVRTIHLAHGKLLYALAWLFTILFTAEYILRLLCVGRPIRYALSFFGIVDFLAIFPAYFSLVFFGSVYLSVVRVLRVLRIFRVLGLPQFTQEATSLSDSLYASRRKIMVFLLTVVTLVVIIGALMYMIEGEQRGFTSIPVSVYWAIVTLTTVGYGDISPQTSLGQFLASVVMILGYSIIAIPTGIVTVEWAQNRSPHPPTSAPCPGCGFASHDSDARFCKRCGAGLRDTP